MTPLYVCIVRTDTIFCERFCRTSDPEVALEAIDVMAEVAGPYSTVTLYAWDDRDSQHGNPVLRIEKGRWRAVLPAWITEQENDAWLLPDPVATRIVRHAS